ncbi:MAG: transglutaminase domain-containing protein [Myxococcota bacterium]|nr:transglutaminase domain-containing protein [Myxococcota bacterium]
MTRARLLAAGLSLARTIPVLLLLLLHGFWTGWLWLIGPVVVVIAGLKLWGWRPTIHRYAALLLGGLGAAARTVESLYGFTFYTGPLPPLVFSSLSGMLLVLACAWSLADRLTASWAAALLLVALAATSTFPSELFTLAGVAVPGKVFALGEQGLFLIPGVVTLGVLLLCLFLLSHARALEGTRVVVFGIYVATVGLGTAGLSWALDASEGVLLPLLEAMLDSSGFVSGLGMQSRVPLASYSSVSLSDQVIVELDGLAPAYFRGQVMDVFDGEVWQASEELQRSIAAPDVSASTQSLTLTVFTGLRESLPAPAGTITRDGVSPEFSAGWLVQGAALRGDQIVLTRRTPDFLPKEGAPGLALRELPDDLAAALRPLAEEIVGDAQTAVEKADAIEAHLQTQHTYSLTSDLRGDAHPLVVLVSEQRSAYCVYFASAMAAMLRSLSVDARMIAGFVAVERNPLTGRTTIRKRDAHAWVEVWLPEAERWAAFDPTPSREAVLDITQPGVLRAVRDFLSRLAVRLRSHPDEVLLELLLSPPVLALMGLGAVVSIRKRLRGRHRVRRRSSVAMTDPALLPLYRRYLALLATQKIVPNAAESDAELLTRLREESPHAGDAASAFIEGYRRARYRGEDVELESLLERLEQALRQQA